MPGGWCRHAVRVMPGPGHPCHFRFIFNSFWYFFAEHCIYITYIGCEAKRYALFTPLCVERHCLVRISIEPFPVLASTIPNDPYE